MKDTAVRTQLHSVNFLSKSPCHWPVDINQGNFTGKGNNQYFGLLDFEN